MTINKLTASFGKLQNETLSFHDGLNVVCSPNESGKSTWCAFIRAMLYGVDSSERARAGHLPDKQRYAPWSGAPMEGSMDLTADNCDITITRTTKTKNAPMREFSAVYTGTNIPVEGMNGSNAGEQLTGVNKDVFCRSAFVAQGAAAVSGSPELERRISAIVSTGEETCSYSEADERLRTWQRKRRYNRRGMLPELEEKMDESRRRLSEMEGASHEIELLEEQLERTQRDCAALEARVTEGRRRQRRESLDKLNAAQGELRRRSDEHDAAIAELSLRREELHADPMGGRSKAELEAEAGRDLDTLRGLKEVKHPSSLFFLALLCFVLAVACAAAYTTFENIVLIVGAVLFAAAALILFLRRAKLQQAAQDTENTRRKILKKYRASGPEEITAALERYSALWDRVSQAEEAERQARAAYEKARDELSQLEESAIHELDFSGGSSDAAKYGRELASARAGAERISAQIATLRGKLSATGDPLVLSSALSCMKDEYEQISGEYEALGLAMEALREADSEIQNRFSPELGRLAAKYMASVTGGRYEDVLLNRDLSARVRASGDTVARDAEYLSAGTLDLMYLAVRLAVCELALPEGEPCPLVIDDALVNLDETRFNQAMKLLKQVARERQVILFTCRK